MRNSEFGMRMRKKAARGRSMKARPTQSRKGVKGKISPCRVKGQRPLWGLGQRPNCSASNLLKGRSQQGAGSEASLPVTSRVLRRAPKLLSPQPAHCHAHWRDRTACLSSIAALPRKQGFRACRREIPACGEEQLCLKDRRFGHANGRDNVQVVGKAAWGRV